MTTLNASEARSRLNSLIDEATETRRPIIITGKRANAVLVSEEYWKSTVETLHLLSASGMRESIIEGMNEDLSKSTPKLDW